MTYPYQGCGSGLILTGSESNLSGQSESGSMNFSRPARGIYSGQPEKFFPPPPLKFFPVFVDFFSVFKLLKDIFTCVLSLFFFFFFPLFLSFFQVLLQNLPCFSIWTKIQIWGEMAIIYIPGQQDRKLIENYGIAKGQETDRNWIEKGQQTVRNE